MQHLVATALCDFVLRSFAQGLSATEISETAGIDRAVCIKLRDMNFTWQILFCSQLVKQNAIQLKIDLDKASKLAECIPGFGTYRHQQLAMAYDRTARRRENGLTAGLVDIFLRQLSVGLLNVVSMNTKVSAEYVIPSRLIKAMGEFPGSLLTLYRRCLILENVAQLDIDAGQVLKAAAVTNQSLERKSLAINLICHGANLAFIQRFLPDFHLTPRLYRHWRKSFEVDTSEETISAGLSARILAEYEKLRGRQTSSVPEAYLMLSRQYGFRIETLFYAISSVLPEPVSPDSGNFKLMEAIEGMAS